VESCEPLKFWKKGISRFYTDFLFFCSFYTGFISDFFPIVHSIVLIILSGKIIYVFISLFSLALWQFIFLLVTFIMTCIFSNSFLCSTQVLRYDKKCKRTKDIAIISLITVDLSMIMTVMNMVFIVRRRQEHLIFRFVLVINSFKNAASDLLNNIHLL
jgi:hypothetical protein